MASLSGVGSIVDPAATGMAGKNMDSLVQLQTVVGIFAPRPEIYNLITWLLCVPLLVLWAFVSLRKTSDPSVAWLALGAAAALSMLPTYHFQHDAKLLLLAIPACAILWLERGFMGWCSLLITGATIIVNGDIFTGIRILLTRRFLLPDAGFTSHLNTVIFTRPGPLFLFAMALFYLWASWQRVQFVKNSPELSSSDKQKTGQHLHLIKEAVLSPTSNSPVTSNLAKRRESQS